MSPAALRALISIVAPPSCSACHGPVADGETLCAECAAGLTRLRGPCPRCALPGHAGPVVDPPRAPGAGSASASCPAAGAAFDSAWAPFAYDGTARRLMHALKLDGRIGLAGWMAREMAAGVPAGAELVPVPAAPARRRRRGFDPAWLLCAALGPPGAVLRRRGSGPRQVGAGRRARREAGRRLVVEVVADAPERVVLVDDVHTTGATLDACARALKLAGTRHVAALTFARAV